MQELGSALARAHSRRGFMKVLGLAGAGSSAVLLAACGGDDEEDQAGGGGDQTQTTGQGASDTEILQLAATAEMLAISFYGQMLENDLVNPPELEREYLEEARNNEQTHLETLQGALGGDAVEEIQFTFPDGTFDSAESAAKVGITLENTFVGAYLGAVTGLEAPKLRTVAGQIASNEAQHLSVFADFVNDNPISLQALPERLTPEQVREAVGPFLPEGSQ